VFSYTIAKNADSAEFHRICKAIEALFELSSVQPLVEDVDGTLIRIYKTKQGEITVVNDCYVDAVYVDSEVEIRIEDIK